VRISRCVAQKNFQNYTRDVGTTSIAIYFVVVIIVIIYTFRGIGEKQTHENLRRHIDVTTAILVSFFFSTISSIGQRRYYRANFHSSETTHVTRVKNYIYFKNIYLPSLKTRRFHHPAFILSTYRRFRQPRYVVSRLSRDTRELSSTDNNLAVCPKEEICIARIKFFLTVKKALLSLSSNLIYLFDCRIYTDRFVYTKNSHAFRHLRWRIVRSEAIRLVE